ncbi:MAG: endonuclease domain-containing protein [Syntrophobacteraceae bacterium]
MGFSDKWILDFFFFENRLGIELDGSIHFLKSQKQRDKEKDKACIDWGITLLRLSNKEVFGDRKLLDNRLREGWRQVNINTNGSSFEMKSK